MTHKKNIKLAAINGKATTTSREVAIHFSKRHANVLRDIENLDCSPQFNQLNFELVEYEDGKNEPRKEYRITRNGFIFLVMGFTGQYAGEIKEAYIYAFDEMESELHRLRQTVPQQGKPRIDAILDSAVSLEKMVLEITYTTQGEVINVNKLVQESKPVIRQQEPTTVHKPSWIAIVETFFNEIESDGIPEKMLQNMLLSKETITLTNGQCEQQDCLFFRPSNLMAFFRKTLRCFDLMNESTIHSTQMLSEQLKTAGVLAFDGKTKEKGIPINSTGIHADVHVRRVAHLVALDLVVLERDYGIVMPSNGKIARTSVSR